MNDQDPRVGEVASRLRGLPECTPPASVWKAVEAGLAERAGDTPTPRAIRAGRWWPAALAASLAAGALLLGGDWGDDGDALSGEHHQALAERITMLAQRSQALERELAGLPMMSAQDPPTLRVLAGRIATVDERLSAGRIEPTPATEELWRTRVDLMESYTRLRREETDALLLRVMY